MNQREQGIRFFVGQHVFCMAVKRTAQLMGVTTSNGSCTVRFHDDGSVAVVHADELRVASWDELRINNTRTRALRYAD